VNSVTPSASRLQDRIVVAFFGLTGEDPRQRSIGCQCGAPLKKKRYCQFKYPSTNYGGFFKKTKTHNVYVISSAKHLITGIFRLEPQLTRSAFALGGGDHEG
jgi:hypothetical protein